MALGEVRGSNKRSLHVLDAQTTTGLAPVLATEGYPVYTNRSKQGVSTGLCYTGRPSEDFTVNVHSTGGTTPTCTIALWGYLEATGKWYNHTFQAGISAAPNLTQIADAFSVRNLSHFDRVYCQLYAVTGGASVSAWITTDDGTAT